MTTHADERAIPPPQAPWAVSVSVELARVGEAFRVKAEAKKTKSAAAISDAKRRLQDAVDAARDAGCSWSQIADAIGERRGNAYAQFHKQAPN